MADEPHKIERADRRDVERPHQRFGDALRSARMNLHLERPDVAEQAAISYPMLANIESGRRRASDEIIERLAPALGLKPDRMREVRDALEADGTRFPTGSGLISYLAGRRQQLFEPADATTKDAATPPSAVERVLSDLLVEAQHAETLALAAAPKQDSTSASQRMQMTSDIIRDLRGLGDTDLAKVRGYVDGLRAAHERAGTSVRPTDDLPLIRLPDQPFGPLTELPMPGWMNKVRRVDLSQRVRRYRDMRIPSGRFAREAGALLAAGPNDDDRPLPCRDHNEATEAAGIGERLARDFAKHAGGNAGMITASDWRSFGSVRAYRMDDARQALILNWVVRMAVVATLLCPDDIDARIDFVRRCLPIAKDQIPLIDVE